jgi:hypothetical protein
VNPSTTVYHTTKRKVGFMTLNDFPKKSRGSSMWRFSGKVVELDPWFVHLHVGMVKVVTHPFPI